MLNKPARDDIKALIAIFIVERRTFLESSFIRSHEYIQSVFLYHIESLKSIETVEAFDDLLRRHLRMSFDEWYESL
jgi:hypothetical protein